MSFNPQITFSDAGGDCPFEVALAPGQDVRPFSIVARWDGSGAGDSFHPCCSIYSQDGKLLSRTRPEQVFAAGDSGVVTYAPFLHSEPEPAPVEGVRLAFVVNNSDGVTEWSDVWAVPADADAAVRVTAFSADEFAQVAQASPDGARIAFTFSDNASDRDLWVIDADGSNALKLATGVVQYFEWLDDTTLVYEPDPSTLKRIDRDGSNGATIVTGQNLYGYAVSPDGTRVALANNAGAQTELRRIDADGSNDTTLVANTLSPFGMLPPAWRLDGSAILFSYNGGQDTIAPDGTGQTTQVAPMPSGFQYPEGIASDRFFYSNRAIFAQWRLAQIVFGVGASIVSPTLYLARNVHSGAAIAAAGRVFTVQDGSLMAGVDSLVSVLPDGSDYTRHFDPNEVGPTFQAVTLR